MTPASLRQAASPFLFQFSLVAVLIGFGLFFDRVASANPPNQSVASLWIEQETLMNSKTQGKDPKAGKADHGAPSEVTWHGGAGRQPYGNQGPEATGQGAGGGEVSEGDRHELSGRNLEQLERVKRRP